MSLLVQRSVVESFKFNDKNIRAVHVNGEEYLVSRDVYEAIGYEEENRKKAIKNLAPSKYKVLSGDVKPSLNQGEDIFRQHKDTVLLKEPGLYCFLLRCKRDEAEPFMECIVEAVLPREVRKLASAIEEKDAALALLTDDLQDCDNQIQTIQYENVALQAQKNVY